MNVSNYHTASCFMCWEGAPNLILYMKFESCFWQKWHSVNHKGLIYAAWSSSNHQYILREDVDTLKQQWMPLITLKNPISHAKRVLKICSFHSVWELFLAEITGCGPEGSCIYTVKSPSNHHHIFRGGSETLKQQWMSFFVSQHPISCVEWVSKI